MAANFPLSFRGSTLRLHRRKVLFEREKALLPAIQVYVEYKNTAERLKLEHEKKLAEFGQEFSQNPANQTTIAWRWRQMFENLSRLHRLIKVKNIEIAGLKEAIQLQQNIPDPHGRLAAARKVRNESKVTRDTLQKEFDVINPEYIQKRDELRTLQREQWMAQASYDDRNTTKKAERREFIMKCPAEECRGFLSTSYKCGTCSKWACQSCLVTIGENRDAEHTCNPDTVESAKMIRAETQPCPKCGTRIFKIDGCDQMWCVMEGCGTAFSWNTGHIVTGVIHNPHYYEWLRRNGGAAGAAREVGDIPCGGMPLTWQFVRAMHDVEIPNDMKTVLLESFRNMQELTTRITEYPARVPQLMNKEEDVAYLMNKLTEDEWKRSLELAEAKFTRKKEIGQILQTLLTAGSDMMNRIYDRIRDDTIIHIESLIPWLRDVGIPELDQLRIFGNDSLKALGKRDHMAVPQFEENWKWKALRALYRSSGKAAPTAPVVHTETEIVGGVVEQIEGEAIKKWQAE